MRKPHIFSQAKNRLRNISITKPIGPVTIMALLSGFYENKVYNKKWKKPKTTTISRNLTHGPCICMI